jgi:hypothetical protein
LTTRRYEDIASGPSFVHLSTVRGLAMGTNGCKRTVHRVRGLRYLLLSYFSTSSCNLSAISTHTSSNPQRLKPPALAAHPWPRPARPSRLKAIISLVLPAPDVDRALLNPRLQPLLYQLLLLRPSACSQLRFLLACDFQRHEIFVRLSPLATSLYL